MSSTTAPDEPKSGKGSPGVADAGRARAVVLRAYERGRLQSAALAALLTLCLVLPGLWLAELTKSALGLALVLAALVVGATYRGGGLGRMALPATLLGLVPLACSLFAARFGHACTPGGCVSLCVPICAAGGLLSGARLGLVAMRGPEKGLSLLFGATVVIVVGSIGCACVGLSSLLAMSGAVACSSGLAVLWRRVRAA